MAASVVEPAGLSRPAAAAVRWLLPGCFLIGALGYLLLGISPSAFAYDEALIAYAAVRVAQGELPYRDFWFIYSPGQLWLMARLFDWWGASLLVLRLVDSGLRLAVVVSVVALAGRLVGARWALLPGAIALAWLGSGEFHGYPMYPALALALAAIWRAVAGVSSGRLSELALSGSLIGLAALFRHDVGLYALTALIGGLGLAFLFPVSGPGVPAHRRLGWTLRAAGVLGGMAGLVALLPLTQLLVAMPFNLLWDQLILFPATTLQWARRLPYPAPWPVTSAPLSEVLRYILTHWIRFYAPLVIQVGALGWGVLTLWRGTTASRRLKAWELTIVSLFGLALFMQALSRYDFIHVLPTTLTAAIVAMPALTALMESVSHRRLAALATIPIVAVLLASYVGPRVNSYLRKSQLTDLVTCRMTLDRAGCIPLFAEHEAAIRYVQAHTRPGERIFVGNERHDQVWGNDVMFYFLAGRDAPGRYHDLFPGVATTETVQRSIISQLEAHGVRYVVLVADVPDRLPEPNGSAINSGVRALDDYIQRTYRPVATYGRWTVWRHQNSQ